jgi:hypothetical protein
MAQNLVRRLELSSLGSSSIVAHLADILGSSVIHGLLGTVCRSILDGFSSLTVCLPRSVFKKHRFHLFPKRKELTSSVLLESTI